MVPAHQRLEAEDLAGPEVDLRLIDQAQLVLRSSARRRSASSRTRVAAWIGQAMIEQLEAVAAARLGPIERGVGVAQQHVALLAVVREDGDADAGGDVQFLLVDPHRRAHGFQQLAHRRHRVLRPLQSRQDEDELVAAHAGHGVAVAQAGLQAAAERHQQPIAHRRARSCR